MSFFMSPGPWLSSFLDGFLATFGPASPVVIQSRSSDGAKVHLLVRDGYTLDSKPGPTKKRRGHVFGDVADAGEDV